MCYNISMELQAEKQRIIQIIKGMPETEARKVINFVDNLEEDLGAPISVQIKNKAQLHNFLEEGLAASKNNEIYPLNETLKMLKSFQNPAN